MVFRALPQLPASRSHLTFVQMEHIMQNLYAGLFNLDLIMHLNDLDDLSKCKVYRFLATKEIHATFFFHMGRGPEAHENLITT